jgi:DNA polymerase gamma 1
MGDLPQGVAFFFAVDVDKISRKEVDIPCTTTSQPIPSSESLNITQVLEQTNGGSMLVDGRPMDESSPQRAAFLPGYQNHDSCLVHRAKGAAFLQAQATTECAEVKHLAQMESGHQEN